MEVSEASLANLVPGPKGDRFAKVDLIIAAIAETITPELAGGAAALWCGVRGGNWAV